MLRQFSTRRIVLFFLADWIGTVFVLVVSELLHGVLQNAPWGAVWAGQRAGIAESSGLVPPSDSLPFLVILIVTFIWPVLFSTFSVYDGRRNESLRKELTNVFLAICVCTMVLAGLLYFTYRETPRTLIALFFALDGMLLCGSRIALWIYRRWGNGSRQTPPQGVLVIGAGQVGRNAVAQVRKYAWANIHLIGFVDDDPIKQGQSLDNLPVLGTLDSLPSLVSRFGVHASIVALPLDAHARLLQTCKVLQSMDVRVYVIPDLFALSFPGAALDGFGGIPVIDLGARGINGLPRFVKRAFDIAIASICLVVLSPFLLLIGVLIKLDSPGSILYRQERLGENGRIFKMYKFRSMRANTSSDLHKKHVTRLIQENLGVQDLSEKTKSLKIETDPRVTRVGKFIRKWSLDELPQLFNVLRGQMSLVGPRPSLPYEVELYKDWHKRRFEAIPGITGLWQVKGRNRVSFDEMVRLDLEYIKCQCFWLDLKILIQTPLAVVSGRGAG